MSTSEIQDRWQSYGPHRPTVQQLKEVLKYIPQQVEVQAVAIRGQGGGVVIEGRYEDAKFIYAFEEDETGALRPSLAERPNKGPSNE